MKKHNFSAGPSVLPEVALETAAKAIFDFNGTGISVLSYSQPFSHLLKFQFLVESGKLIFNF